METVSIVLAITCCAILFFSYWSFKSIQKHIKRFDNNYKFSSGLTDEKYFELKARQDYIIASSAMVFAVITFVGIGSLKDVKSKLSEQIETEVTKSRSIGDSAESALKRAYFLVDTLEKSLVKFEELNKQVSEISKKEILKQSLFIVENIQLKDYPFLRHNSPANGVGYKFIRFEKLYSISGKKLPIFTKAPSIMVFTTTGGQVSIPEVSTEGFKVLIVSDKPQLSATGPIPNFDPQDLNLTVWISQRE